MNSVQLVVSNAVVEVSIKEFQGQRVVTLRDVDNLHQRTSGTARRTFASQKKHFIEGEDYFVRNTYEAFAEYSIKAPNGLVLLTESGYLLLVKTFTDDLAWQVQRQLVKAYFKAKELVPQTQEDILIFTLQNQKEMKKRLEKLEAENKQLRLVVDNEVWITDQQRALLQEAVNKRVGKLKARGYDAHFQGIYRTLKDHFTVPNYTKIKRTDFETALDIISGWYPKKKDEAI